MDWDRDPTPAVDDYLAWERDDAHLWARIPSGHHRNLFDQAVDARDAWQAMAERATDAAQKGTDLAVEYHTECDRLREALEQMVRRADEMKAGERNHDPQCPLCKATESARAALGKVVSG